MNILFLTIAQISDIKSRGIYTDLMRRFSDEAHNVFIVTPTERRNKESTKLVRTGNVTLLKVKIFNTYNTNVFEKGLSTLLIEYQYLYAIKKFFSKIKFDIVLYSTPPITFTRVIRHIKNNNGSLSYLLLKDIFPQNAVDIGMIQKDGLLHRYFRKREKEFYAISDYIGCMSQANVDYLCRHNPKINPKIVEVNPNCIEPIVSHIKQNDKIYIRKKYNIPENSTVFIYGGNLGKPQGIEFLIEVLDSPLIKDDAFFVIVGTGTEYYVLNQWFENKHPDNVLLLSFLPRQEFDTLLQASDVGLIFLDKRFTIPNFPSRLLSYLEYKLPIVAATDKNTDLGKVIVENGFGLWSESGNLHSIIKNINFLVNNFPEKLNMGSKGYQFMIDNYTVSVSFKKIMTHLG